MSRRSIAWRVVGVLFTVINLGGAVYAAVLEEWLHAGVHVGLLLLGAGVMWGVARRSREASLTSVPRTDEQLNHVQQSLDAIAIEVERIGESQRFSTRLQAERIDAQR